MIVCEAVRMIEEKLMEDFRINNYNLYHKDIAHLHVSHSTYLQSAHRHTHTDTFTRSPRKKENRSPKKKNNTKKIIKLNKSSNV